MTKHRYMGKQPFLVGAEWRWAHIAPDEAAMHWTFTPSAEGMEKTVYELSSGGTLAEVKAVLADAIVGLLKKDIGNWNNYTNFA